MIDMSVTIYSFSCGYDASAFLREGRIEPAKVQRLVRPPSRAKTHNSSALSGISHRGLAEAHSRALPGGAEAVLVAVVRLGIERLSEEETMTVPTITSVAWASRRKVGRHRVFNERHGARGRITIIPSPAIAREVHTKRARGPRNRLIGALGCADIQAKAGLTFIRAMWPNMKAEAALARLLHMGEYHDDQEIVANAPKENFAEGIGLTPSAARPRHSGPVRQPSKLLSQTPTTFLSCRPSSSYHGGRFFFLN